MRELGELDESFLLQDRPGGHGHSGTLLIFDGSTAEAELGAGELRRLVRERLDRAPVLRWRLEGDPARPGRHRWVEAADIDLERHVAEHRLAPATDDRALGRLTASINGPSLDHSRPLWELHVIRGRGSDRVAVLLKFHHALGDVEPNLDVIFALFGEIGHPDDAVVQRPVRAPSSSHDPAPADIDAEPPAVPFTRFNTPLSEERAFAFGLVDKRRIEQLRRAAGVTFHELVTAAWGGALRGWLALRGEVPAEPLVARVPVSLRDVAHDREPGNRLAVVPVPLPTHLADATSRLDAARVAMAAVKRALHQPPRRGRGPAMNLSLSTYRGAHQPLAWLGAPVVMTVPLAMISGCGLSIATGTIRAGVVASVHVDAGHVPNPWTLLRAFELSLDDLEANQKVAGRRWAGKSASRP